MTDRRYGGFWRRFFACLIDRIVLYLVSLFLILTGITALRLSGVSLGRIIVTGNLPSGMGLFAAVYAVAMFITDMIYFTWFHGSVGQTPGKMLLGLRVIQTSGGPMTFGVAFLRWVGALVSGLFLLLGYLWIAFDGRKQGWHDKIAATLVVRTGNEQDCRSSPDGPAHPSPDSPPAAQTSAEAGTACQPHPPAVPASNTVGPAGTPSAPADPADRDSTGPAGGAPGDLPGRG